MKGDKDVKLDMELIRALLLYVEEKATKPISDLEEIPIDGFSAEEITYHVVLAHDAGLLKATIQEVPGEEYGSSDYEYTVHSLTFQGHEFLETVRDPSNWSAVKSGAAKAGAFTVKAMAGFAEAYIDQKIRQFAGAPSI